MLLTPPHRAFVHHSLLLPSTKRVVRFSRLFDETGGLCQLKQTYFPPFVSFQPIAAYIVLPCVTPFLVNSMIYIRIAWLRLLQMFFQVFHNIVAAPLFDGDDLDPLLFAVFLPDHFELRQLTPYVLHFHVT